MNIIIPVPQPFVTLFSHSPSSPSTSSYRVGCIYTISLHAFHLLLSCQIRSNALGGNHHYCLMLYILGSSPSPSPTSFAGYQLYLRCFSETALSIIF